MPMTVNVPMPMPMIVPMPMTVPVIRMRMAMVVLMPVVPQLRFIQQKEEHQAHQQGCKQAIGTRLAFESLGQEVHEGGGQKCSGSQAQEVLCPDRGAIAAGAHTQAHQERSEPDAADAGAEGGDNNGDQGHSSWRRGRVKRQGRRPAKGSS